MVAVDYPDPPGEAQTQNQLSGVPQGAQLAGAFAEQAQVYGTVCRSTWTPTNWTGPRSRLGKRSI
jgi:hypothetical protein